MHPLGAPVSVFKGDLAMKANSRRTSDKERSRVFAAIAGGVVALVVLAHPQSAAAKSKACKTSITACGCVAKKAAHYVVSKPLTSASASLDCLTVSAAHAVIDMGGNSITGPGGSATGAGIHILSSADGAVIESGGLTNSINNFGVGVLVDASNVVIETILLLSNAQYGGVVNGGSNNAFYDLDAGQSTNATSGNGIAGIKILNGNNNFIDDVIADHNTKYGIEISGGSNNSVHDSDGDSNGIYGIWIHGSNGNRLVNSTGRHNAQVGLYIGCAATGGPGASCASSSTASTNVVKFGEWSSNTKIGVGVDTGDLANQIGINKIDSNLADDAVDENINCGTNLWFLDSIDFMPAQACIQ